MKKILLTLILFSCRENKEIPSRKIDFVIAEKTYLKDEYYFKDKDTIIECSKDQFLLMNLGDTLVLEIPREGFFRGTVFLEKYKPKKPK